jgi:hypothetical protein
MSKIKKLIFIPLLNEGTEVGRPTYGELISDNIYRVLPTEGYNSEDESWKFPPYTLVICDVEENSEGHRVLIAREIWSEQEQ